MKTLLISLSTALLINTAAQAQTDPILNDANLKQVCVTAMKNDVSGFNKIIGKMSSVAMGIKRSDVLDYLNNEDNFQCNNYGLQAWVERYQATDVANAIELESNIQFANR